MQKANQQPAPAPRPASFGKQNVRQIHLGRQNTRGILFNNTCDAICKALIKYPLRLGDGNLRINSGPRRLSASHAVDAALIIIFARAID